MSNLLATLAAAVIGAFVLFAAAAINWRTVHATDSAAQYASSKVSLQSLVEVIEVDLSNLGAGLTNNTLKDVSPAGSATDAYRGGFYAASGSPWDFTSSTRYLQFCSVLDTSTSTLPDPTTNTCDVVRYEWSQQGTVQVRDNSTTASDYITVPVYRLDRSVNGTADGGSLTTLTEIDFEPLGANGAPTSVPEDVRAVRVSLRAVSPLNGGSGYLDEDDPALAYDMDQTRWSRTIRPPNLARVPGAN